MQEGNQLNFLNQEGKQFHLWSSAVSTYGAVLFQCMEQCYFNVWSSAVSMYGAVLFQCMEQCCFNVLNSVVEDKLIAWERIGHEQIMANAFWAMRWQDGHHWKRLNAPDPWEASQHEASR